MTDTEFEAVMTCCDPKPVPLIPIVAICADHDDECPDVPNKVTCWLYDPARGVCPFLRSDA
ncbi:hypothetical protein D3C87_1724330 [compost metagenome]